MKTEYDQNENGRYETFRASILQSIRSDPFAWYVKRWEILQRDDLANRFFDQTASRRRMVEYLSGVKVGVGWLEDTNIDHGTDPLRQRNIIEKLGSVIPEYAVSTPMTVHDQTNIYFQHLIRKQQLIKWSGESGVQFIGLLEDTAGFMPSSIFHIDGGLDYYLYKNEVVLDEVLKLQREGKWIK